MSLYDQHSLGMERSRKAWEKYFEIPKTAFVCSEQNGKLDAYVVCGKGEDFSDYIHEWAGSADTLPGLVRYCLEEVVRGDAVTVLAPDPRHPFPLALKRAGALMHTGFLGLVKILNASSLWEKLHSAVDRVEFEERDHETGWIFRAGEEELVIENERTLTRIFFGPEPPSAYISLPDSLRCLDDILPVRFFIWGLDSV